MANRNKIIVGMLCVVAIGIAASMLYPDTPEALPSKTHAAAPVLDLARGDIVQAATSIRVSPAPGILSGGAAQRASATGVITNGPEMVDSVPWWYVDFESGQDGWVAGSMITH